MADWNIYVKGFSLYVQHRDTYTQATWPLIWAKKNPMPEVWHRIFGQAQQKQFSLGCDPPVTSDS